MFKMNDKKIDVIAKEFNVNKYIVQKLINHYEIIKRELKGQYLAHITRILEERMRKLTKNIFFRIILTPLPVDDKTLIAKANYKKGEFFRISYPAHLEDKQLRIAIAHELSHLYLLTFGDKATEDSTEPLSTILGILMIADKNDFYSNIKEKGLLHKDFEDILADFKQLNNRLGKIFNKS